MAMLEVPTINPKDKPKGTVGKFEQSPKKLEIMNLEIE